MASHTQTWWVEGQILASGPISLQDTHGQLHAARSYAYCCPKCGEVWARRIVSPETHWMFWAVGCAKHPDNRLYGTPPGGIVLSFDEHLLRTLPLAMLRREAELCCKSWA